MANKKKNRKNFNIDIDFNRENFQQEEQRKKDSSRRRNKRKRDDYYYDDEDYDYE